MPMSTKQHALVNREPTEERLREILLTLLDRLRLLGLFGSDREIVLARAASVRIHERAGILQDGLRRIFDNWKTFDVTPPFARPRPAEPATKPPSSFEPTPIGPAPRELGRIFVSRSADAIRKIVEEEVSSAEVLEAADQLAESVKELEELVHAKRAPEV
jgi:hypothetical protein